MNVERKTSTPAGHHDNEYAWFREGSLPHAREDFIAEALALVALLFALGIGLVIAMLPMPGRAATLDTAPAGPTLVLSAFKVVPAALGKPERLEPATEARAGDQLEYQAVYRNPTAAAVHHVMVTVPVPATGVEYVLGTASPRPDLASTDGHHFAALPLQRTETSADGHQVTRPAPGADYHFLRWDLGDVPAGAVRTVRSRVQLLGNTVASR